MRSERFKSLVDSGRYTPQPAAIAEAMLRHPGVRALLTEGVSLESADRSPEARLTSRRAA
jgi:hypothetical protein